RNLVTGPDAKAACRGFGWRREGGLRAAGHAQVPSGAQRIPWPRPGGFLYPGFGQSRSYIHWRRPQAKRANPPPGTGPAVRSGPSDGLIGRVLNWEDAWARARINVPKLICDVPVITVSCCPIAHLHRQRMLAYWPPLLRRTATVRQVTEPW